MKAPGGTIIVGPEGIILFTSIDLGFGDPTRTGEIDVEIKARFEVWADSSGNVRLKSMKTSELFDISPEHARNLARLLMDNADAVERREFDE